MAKNLKYNRSTTETITVKGIMSDDSTEIVFLNDEKEEETVKVQTLLDQFASCGVALSIKKQSDEELELVESDDEIA